MVFWNSNRDDQSKAGAGNHTGHKHRTRNSSKSRSHTLNPELYDSQNMNPLTQRYNEHIGHRPEKHRVLKKHHRTRKVTSDATYNSDDRKEDEYPGVKNEYTPSDTAYCHDQVTTDTHPSIDVSSKHQINPTNRKAVPVGNNLWSWIPYVAQPADDATVSARVKELFVFAEQYVNNFYDDRKYDGNIRDELLEPANTSQLLSTPQLQTCLAEADRQTPFIKHILVCLLLDLISFDSGTSKTSLLPKEFQNFNVLTKARTLSESSSIEIPHLQPALSAYRVLSGYIRSDILDDPNFIREKSETSERIAAIFEQAFQYWIQRHKSSRDRVAAFRHLIDRAANLGVFLFSQPSVFFFNWEMTRKDHARKLVPVWPFLLRVFDNNAQLRAISDVMIPMKLVAVFDDSDDELQEFHISVGTSSSTTNAELSSDHIVRKETTSSSADEESSTYDTPEVSMQPLRNRSPNKSKSHHEVPTELSGDESPNQQRHHSVPNELEAERVAPSRYSKIYPMTPDILRPGLKNPSTPTRTISEVLNT